MVDRLHSIASYSGPLFWQRFRLLCRVLIDLHRIGRGQCVTFDFMLY